jgi:hypothetical protein
MMTSLISPEGLLCGPLVLPLDGEPRLWTPGKVSFRDRLRETWRARDETGTITATGIFALIAANTISNGGAYTGQASYNLLSSHQRCAMFTNSVNGGSSVNFDDTIAHSGYNQTGGQFTANEVSGAGYSAGGAGDGSSSGTFGASPAVSNSSGVITYSNSDAQWTSSTISSAAGALIYDNFLSTKTAWILVSFGGSYSTNNGTFTIHWSGSGIFYMTVHS